jgi:RNA polymerase sigma-70 factor, ECF subfamily
MSNLKFSQSEEEKSRNMFFNQSTTFDQEELPTVAIAAQSSVVPNAESEFIESLKAGDSEAFDIFVNRYSANVYALLFRLTENVEEAQDLTQDTFLRALKAIKNFRGESNLKTWLFRIAVNETKNRWRWWKRRKNDSIVSLDAENNFNETPLSETIADVSENPETAVLRREREFQLQKMLRELPQNFREVIILRDIEGLSYDEIAVALSTNVGTIKSRIARGREELRKKLSGF